MYTLTLTMFPFFLHEIKLQEWQIHVCGARSSECEIGSRN